MIVIRNTVAILVILFAGLVTTEASPQVSAQSGAVYSCYGDILACRDSYFRWLDEGSLCFVTYGASACDHAWDARNWAIDVTKWKFPKSKDGDIGNAFAHCSWSGALATRVGSSDAYGITFIHENRTDNPAPHRLMDEWNNFVGSQIGSEAVSSGASDTWGYVMNKCEEYARDGKLYGLCGVKGAYLGPYFPEPDC